jgi:SAM-dependent methyltransferase
VSLGRDPNYLRSDQYRDSANLGDRVTLHDRFSTNREGWFPWLFARLGLESGERVLEVGGGPGWLWLRGPPAPPPGIDLVMSDLSAGMAREARGNLAGRVERLRVCVLDARQIPFPDASFDVALANHMLYHVPDRPRALAEIARVLRPGGRLVASTIGERHLCEIDALARDLCPDTRLHMGFDSAFTLESGAQQLESWFDDVRLERYPDGLRISEVDPLVAYVRSMIAVQRVDASRESALRHRVEAEIARVGWFAVTKDSGLLSARRPGV